MMEKILKEFDEIDNRIMRYINIGLSISFGICALGIVCLLIYNKYGVSYDTYNCGLILIKTGIIFVAQCFGCGFVTDKLIKNKI